MNRCADLDAGAADADLNRVCQQLLSKLNNDDNATQKSGAAQHVWLALRDVPMEEVSPAKDKQAEYASI